MHLSCDEPLQSPPVTMSVCAIRPYALAASACFFPLTLLVDGPPPPLLPPSCMSGYSGPPSGAPFRRGNFVIEKGHFGERGGGGENCLLKGEERDKSREEGKQLSPQVGGGEGGS